MRLSQTKINSAQAWLQFVRDQRWSAKQKHHLLSTFITPAELYDASEIEISECMEGESWLRKESFSKKDVELDLAWLAQENCHLITCNEQYYPSSLSEITDPALALFAIGNPELLNKSSVAIVGSRRPTPVGARIATEFAAQLAELGISIVSGMALGIDGLVHQSVLDNAGNTVSVLGCGVDVTYPARHRKMYQAIVDQGCVISEFPLRTAPTRYNFPKRNRIISGLCHGVIIIEAAEKSGTLITARLAMEQNREVMVVPGSVSSSQYQGSHRLIQQGAALVTCRDDVLAMLSEPLKQNLKLDGLKEFAISQQQTQTRNPLAQQILAVLGAEPISQDQIITECGLSAAQASSQLLALELDGLVARADQGGYVSLV